MLDCFIVSVFHGLVDTLYQLAFVSLFWYLRSREKIERPSKLLFKSRSFLSLKTNRLCHHYMDKIRAQLHCYICFVFVLLQKSSHMSKWTSNGQHAMDISSRACSLTCSVSDAFFSLDWTQRLIVKSSVASELFNSLWMAWCMLCFQDLYTFEIIQDICFYICFNSV